jgi:hypothetical protein
VETGPKRTSSTPHTLDDALQDHAPRNGACRELVTLQRAGDLQEC